MHLVVILCSDSGYCHKTAVHIIIIINTGSSLSGMVTRSQQVYTTTVQVYTTTLANCPCTRCQEPIVHPRGSPKYANRKQFPDSKPATGDGGISYPGRKGQEKRNCGFNQNIGSFLHNNKAWGAWGTN